MGQVGASANQAEAASEAKLAAAAKGYFDVLKEQSSKAESKEERESIRKDANAAFESVNRHDEAKSEKRFQFSWKVVGGIAVAIGVASAGAVKLLKGK
jgi:hypothetical protein